MVGTAAAAAGGCRIQDGHWASRGSATAWTTPLEGILPHLGPVTSLPHGVVCLSISKDSSADKISMQELASSCVSIKFSHTEQMGPRSRKDGSIALILASEAHAHS